MSDLLRVYLDPAEIGKDGYPFAWHGKWPKEAGSARYELVYSRDVEEPGSIKDLIRERDGHRCLRCSHPYRKGEHGTGEWSPCDEICTHLGPYRWWDRLESRWWEGHATHDRNHSGEEAKWRILTVHHLTGVKHDCRWWNLVSLCQRCHLTIQGKVYMDRAWNRPHSEWFRPFAAGFYAWKYLDEDLTQEETLARLDELLALEQTMDPLF